MAGRCAGCARPRQARRRSPRQSVPSTLAFRSLLATLADLRSWFTRLRGAGRDRGGRRCCLHSPWFLGLWRISCPLHDAGYAFPTARPLRLAERCAPWAGPYAEGPTGAIQRRALAHLVARTAAAIETVDEYLVDLNATQAAIRAGYSAKTAAVIGAQNLRKLKVAEAIEKARTKRAERTELTQDWV